MDLNETRDDLPFDADAPLNTSRPLDRPQAERRFGIQGEPAVEPNGTPLDYVVDSTGTALIPRRNQETLSSPRVRENPVDELNMASTVKELRAAGHSYASISRQTGIDPGAISQWCDNYDRMPTAQKRLLGAEDSIFNFNLGLEYTNEQLKRLIERINTAMDEAEQNQTPLNPALALALTAAIKAHADAQVKAMNYVKTVKSIQDRDMFRKALLSALSKKSPGLQAEVMREMQRFKDQYDTLGGTIPDET